MNYFSWSRFWAVLLKEFVQMRRDRLTFAMMVGIPILQLILFGFAINADPKALPTAVLIAERFIRRPPPGLRRKAGEARCGYGVWAAGIPSGTPCIPGARRW